MAKKPRDEEEEEEDEDFDDEEEDDGFIEGTFKCRVCKKEVKLGDGDDLIAVCDGCLENYDEDRIWDDYDADKITDEELLTFDLSKYLKATKKKAKK